jgi:hypothetical protein
MSSPQAPLVGSSGIWFSYFQPQAHAGDGEPHQLLLDNAGVLGNESLFIDADSGVALNHRALVNVDVHASCSHEVAIERHLAVQLDKGASGGLMERGTANFVAGLGNAAYQGILEAGHVIRVIVSAPGDEVEIRDGYVSVTATPI